MVWDGKKERRAHYRSSVCIERERERKKQVLGRAERALWVKVGTVLGSVGS